MGTAGGMTSAGGQHGQMNGNDDQKVWGMCVLAATALLMGGCGTIWPTSPRMAALRIYGGVGRDAEQMVDTYTFAPNAVVYFGGLFALACRRPFSAIGDTLDTSLCRSRRARLDRHLTGRPATTILRPSLEGPPCGITRRKGRVFFLLGGKRARPAGGVT